MFLHNFGAIHALIETYRITGYERIRKALIHYTHGRARRKAVREAILGTLQRFSVITRTRGGRPWTAQLAEDDS